MGHRDDALKSKAVRHKPERICMRTILSIPALLILAGSASAGQVTQPSIACKNKSKLDMLTILAASGQTQRLEDAEEQFLQAKECIRMARGTEVSIVDAKRVMAGDPKARTNAGERRVSYHIAMVKVDDKTWFTHLRNLKD